MANSSNWDVETTGGKLIIRDDFKRPHLILKTVDAETLEVEHIISVLGDKIIIGNEVYFQVINRINGKGSQFQNCLVSNCHTGFAL